MSTFVGLLRLHLLRIQSNNGPALAVPGMIISQKTKIASDIIFFVAKEFIFPSLQFCSCVRRRIPLKGKAKRAQVIIRLRPMLADRSAC